MYAQSKKDLELLKIRLEKAIPGIRIEKTFQKEEANIFIQENSLQSKCNVKYFFLKIG